MKKSNLATTSRACLLAAAVLFAGASQAAPLPLYFVNGFDEQRNGFSFLCFLCVLSVFSGWGSLEVSHSKKFSLIFGPWTLES